MSHIEAFFLGAGMGLVLVFVGLTVGVFMGKYLMWLSGRTR